MFYVLQKTSQKVVKNVDLPSSSTERVESLVPYSFLSKQVYIPFSTCDINLFINCLKRKSPQRFLHIYGRLAHSNQLRTI